MDGIREVSFNDQSRDTKIYPINYTQPTKMQPEAEQPAAYTQKFIINVG